MSSVPLYIFKVDAQSEDSKAPSAKGIVSDVRVWFNPFLFPVPVAKNRKEKNQRLAIGCYIYKLYSCYIQYVVD